MNIGQTSFHNLFALAKHILIHADLLPVLWQPDGNLQELRSPRIRPSGTTTLSEVPVYEKRTSLLRILNKLAQSDADAAIEQAKNSWRSGSYYQEQPEALTPANLLSLHGQHKAALLEVARSFATDLQQYAQLAQELDAFYTDLNIHTLDSLQEWQREGLEREKEFNAAIVNNSIDGIFAFDNWQHIQEWNPVLELWYSLEREEVIGKKVFEIFPELIDSEEGRATLGALKGEEVFISERAFTNRPGFYEAHILPLYNGSHEICGGVCIIHETTHRKETEQAIQQQNQALSNTLEELKTTSFKLELANQELEQRVNKRTSDLEQRENFLNSMIALSPISTWILDDSGFLVQANRASQQLFGLENVQDLIGHYNILQDKALNQEVIQTQLAAVFSEGTTARFTTDYQIGLLSAPHAAPPVQYKALIFTIFPIKGEDGRLLNAVLQHEDITEMKLAQQQKLQGDEQLMLIADAVPALIAYVDRQKKFRFVNREFERWFHLRREEILNQHVSELIGEKAYHNVAASIERTLQGERVQQETLQEYHGKVGSKHISYTFIPHVVQQRVEGFISLVTDITERKKQEQFLQKLYQESHQRNEELKRINADLDNFVYTASHDLKAPIANVEGLLSLITREITPKLQERDKKLIELMGVSLTKLKQTVEDLIGITMMRRQGEPLPPEEVYFSEIAEAVKADLQLPLEQSGAQLTEQYEVKQVLFARSHLRSILYNLLSNAIKYRSPERQAKIVVSTHRQGSRLVLTVTDNGLGMTPEQQQKLFSMFARMHPHIEGTGIGLYAIKRIIESMGGSIEVESTPGVGSCFSVFFQDQA